MLTNWVVSVEFSCCGENIFLDKEELQAISCSLFTVKQLNGADEGEVVNSTYTEFSNVLDTVSHIFIIDKLICHFIYQMFPKSRSVYASILETPSK